MKKFSQIFFILFILSAQFSNAVETFPVAARFFVGSLNVDPTNLNQEMTAQSLNKIDAVTLLGLEVSRSITTYLDWGLRYTKRSVTKQAIINNPLTNYQGDLNQDSAMLLLRIPIFKSNIIRAEIYGGVGGSNTTFKMKSATQNGELTRAESGDWFATPYSSVGATLAIGYSKYFFTIEAGMETNKVDNFKRTGTLNTNINTIDLSGSFVNIGFMFDGVSASSK